MWTDLLEAKSEVLADPVSHNLLSNFGDTSLHFVNGCFISRLNKLRRSVHEL